MKCTNCGKTNDPEAIFCDQCGAALLIKTCPKCGKENKSDSHFCKYCGQAMGQPVPAPLPSQPAVPVLPALAPVVTPRRKIPAWGWGLISLAGLSLIIVLVILLGPQVLPGLFTANPPTRVASTKIPTRTATTNPYLLYDEFNNPNSGWPTMGDTTVGEAGYGNGFFRIAFYQPGGFQAAWSPLTYKDFIAETRICTSPATPGIGAGLILRATEENWYMFWVYPGSREFVFFEGGNQYTGLIPLTRSEIINPADSDGRLCFNLKAAVHGDTFDFWIAGADNIYQYLASMHVTEMTFGKLGPSADSTRSVFPPSPVEALFEWIKVSPYTDQPMVVNDDATKTPTPTRLPIIQPAGPTWTPTPTGSPIIQPAGPTWTPTRTPTKTPTRTATPYVFNGTLLADPNPVPWGATYSLKGTGFPAGATVQVRVYKSGAGGWELQSSQDLLIPADGNFVAAMGPNDNSDYLPVQMIARVQHGMTEVASTVYLFDPEPAPPPQPPPVLNGTLNIYNHSDSVIIYYVYIDLSTEDLWGPNRLGSGEVIYPNQYRSWTIPVGIYDIKIEAMNHNQQRTWSSVNVDGNGITKVVYP